MYKQTEKTYEDIYFDRLDYLKERISGLIKNNNFFEVILWFTNIIDAEITILLSLYEKNIKLADEIYTKFLKDYAPRSCEEIRQEGKTLGKLKNELTRYLKDKETIDLLTNFISVRNKINHKFFETSENPEIIEKEIKSNINNWWDLCYKLSEEMNKLLRQYNKLLNQYSKMLEDGIKK